MERRVQAWMHGKPYHERYNFVPLNKISPDFQHAVIAAEDARFYQHHGFDWHAMEIAAEDDMEGGRIRGGSTITQQLVKNLFFGTGRSYSAQGRGVYAGAGGGAGAGQAADSGALSERGGVGSGNLWRGRGEPVLLQNAGAKIGREQAARLAAILPAPLKRRPERMTKYSGLILERMRQMGW